MILAKVIGIVQDIEIQLLSDNNKKLWNNFWQ